MLNVNNIETAALYIAVLICLVAIAWIDHTTMEIPDSLNLAIAACGLVVVLIAPDADLKTHLIGIAVASVPLFVFSLFIEGAFGFGDVKLMAASGLFLGWQNCLVALLLGFVFGGIYAAFQLILKKKTLKDHIAFGPALCAGIGVSMFAGRELIDAYFIYF